MVKTVLKSVDSFKSFNGVYLKHHLLHHWWLVSPKLLRKWLRKCSLDIIWFKLKHFFVYFVFWCCSCCRVGKLLSRRSSGRPKTDPKKNEEISSEADGEDEDLHVERIRLENMELRFFLHGFSCRVLFFSFFFFLELLVLADY